MCWVVFRFRKKSKVVLIDTYSGMAFTYAIVVAFLSKVFGVPYVPILRGGNLPDRFNKNPKISQRFIENAAHVIVPSEYLKRDMEARGWDSPVLIPNSIDIEVYPFKKREFVSPKLLWVRSFHKIYNPLMALEVLRILRDKGYRNAQLCMIGQDKDGTMKEFKNQVRELGLQQYVEVTGRMSKNKWIEKSDSFNIFINTTNFDNTPISVMEAMALGLPVVSTNVGGIPFLLNDQETALLVKKSDTTQMVQCVIELLENPGLGNRIATQARKEVEQFSWDHVKSLWIEKLKKLL